MPTHRSRLEQTCRPRPSRVAACIALLQMCLPSDAFAAHPLQTEDTGTQGSGNVEFENGLTLSHSAGARLFMYQPQFSFGATPVLDLIVQPAWLDSRDSDGHTQRGRGDTNFDLKWRFFGSAPVSFAVRAGATAATSEHGVGLRSGTAGVHALLVTTIDIAPFTLHGNLGLTRNPRSSGQRTDVTGLSTALMWAPNERLVWTVDAGSAINSDPADPHWITTLLAGAIYTIRPGLDVDVGYQATVRASVPAREWLVGVTYRFGI